MASSTKRVRRKRLAPPRSDADPYGRWTGGIASRSSYPTPATGGYLENHFLPLPVDRTIELRWDLSEDFDGVLPVDPKEVDGARVKPVIYVPEEKADLVDRDGLRSDLLGMGAVYCKAPTVHVVRKKVQRDDRHAVEVPLEESLRMFAEETNPRDPDARVEFAATLAREADAGAEE
jgi:hypothetical protein